MTGGQESRSPQEEPKQEFEFSRIQGTGILIFMATSAFAAMEASGFGAGIELPMNTWLVVSCVGGAVGGSLIGRGNRLAGAVAGAIAGPIALYAVHFYTEGQSSVHTAVVALITGVASLPGVGIYFGMKWIMGDRGEPKQ